VPDEEQRPHGRRMEGSDALSTQAHRAAFYEAMGEAVDRARRGGGPTLLESKLGRFFGHFEGDAQTYRGKDEVKILRETKDCLVKFRNYVTDSGMIDEAQLESIDKSVLQLIDEAVNEAKAAPKPSESDLLTDVYVSY